MPRVKVAALGTPQQHRAGTLPIQPCKFSHGIPTSGTDLEYALDPVDSCRPPVLSTTPRTGIRGASRNREEQGGADTMQAAGGCTHTAPRPLRRFVSGLPLVAAELLVRNFQH